MDPEAANILRDKTEKVGLIISERRSEKLIRFVRLFQLGSPLLIWLFTPSLLKLFRKSKKFYKLLTTITSTPTKRLSPGLSKEIIFRSLCDKVRPNTG
ncbi:hypothetical protein AYI68_g5853 [Smittium mucronatum]|uniref:Uncharacterized protein n=1 Tax=Smittium mucronatum TaxID=133383 RepID=A0A1R0GT40_9FUNG|nr:hypothetical protein AYI68_g5853 [Smittium mucronatum]